MSAKRSDLWKQALRGGLIAGAVVLLLALVGMVKSLAQRFVIYNVISTGQVLLLAPMFIFALQSATRTNDRRPWAKLLVGATAGTIAGVLIALLVLLGQVVNLRAMFLNASPELYQELTYGQELPLGALVPMLGGLVTGLLGGAAALLPSRARSAVTQALLWVVLLGLIRDLMMTIIVRWGPVAPIFEWFYATNGLKPIGAAVVAVIIGGLMYLRGSRAGVARAPRFGRQQVAVRYALIGFVVLILFLLPPIVGIFISDVLDTTGLYALMGLGLNIVVGFAGLLDLGYVAFWAIGAYAMGVLTSPELGFFNLSYWAALPFALVIVVVSGLLFGLPVLKMRGDYLAIVTLGFGEIVRILAGSDWLWPYLGGSQGIQRIAQPAIGSFVFSNQTQLYYLILVACMLAAFMAIRLKDSRLGRAWMAVREDEDVATAMGIDPVATKLLAFATGAAMAGLSGTLFGAKLTSVYSHSFNFLVSINVLSLIIIGGMGSIPGVVVGSLALVGLPEFLREFAEYRYLVYGALLVGMMLTRPEGLMPEARRKLELHEEELLAAAEAPAVGQEA
ncbi:MAG: leucine/isoleucine/valine transporter permease subunit [Chloroflexota bacterium]